MSLIYSSSLEKGGVKNLFRYSIIWLSVFKEEEINKELDDVDELEGLDELDELDELEELEESDDNELVEI